MAINFNTHQTHPLIEREQTYFLEKSYITIHSEDRDAQKWKNSNNFEIKLPKDLNNVINLRLSDIAIPNNIYTFTEEKQNTKFRFTVIPQLNTTDLDASLEFAALENVNISFDYYEATITEGQYTPQQLAFEIQNTLNNTVTDTLRDIEINGTPSFELPGECYHYDNFIVKYNPATNKMNIINPRDSFEMLFNEQIPYTITCKNKEKWGQLIDWGFPYFIGFDKKKYISLIKDTVYYVNSIDYKVCASTAKISDAVYYLVSHNQVDIDGDKTIYMEVDKYNNTDEIEPHIYACDRIHSDNYSGKVDSLFAKIFLTSKQNEMTFLTKKNDLNMVSAFKVPINKITRLRFKFRRHDGSLIDFQNKKFNFTIEATHLIDEQLRMKIINNIHPE